MEVNVQNNCFIFVYILKEMKKIKEAVFKECINQVNRKTEYLNQFIANLQNDLQSETKSSAGDKHETNRAMLQLEMEKASQQFITVNKMNEVLQKININAYSKTAKLGSLIYTNQHIYFLAVSLGEIEVFGNKIFVISTLSPIGRLLLGKTKGDTFFFNQKQMDVLNIF